MLDLILLLIVVDYDEWGNFEDFIYFNYICEYLLYDILKEWIVYLVLFVLVFLNDIWYDFFLCIYFFYFIMNCRRLSRNLVVFLVLSFFFQMS